MLFCFVEFSWRKDVFFTFKVISLHGAVFSYFILHPSNFQVFFAFERPESLATLPDLPEPTYLSLPIFPLVLHCRESF